jgi:soluble lytic murein transglycosylase-like protein
MATAIDSAAKRYDLDQDLLKAVIAVESSYKPKAKSPKGAKGPMQLMPATAKEMGVTDRRDISQNIHGGAKYLRHLLDRFGNLEHALAAYNAGPTAVRRYEGVPPYPETQKYIQKVMTYYQGGETDVSGSTPDSKPVVPTETQGVRPGPESRVLP